MSRRSLAATAALLVFHAAAALADAPSTLPVQGTLRSASGGPVTDGTYVLFLKLYGAADAKAPLWKEAQSGIVVRAGLFHLELGAAEKGLASLLATGKPLWLGVQVGSDPELPRVRLSAVAYAHWAAIAAGLDCSACVTGAMLADGSVAASKVKFTWAASASKGGPATHALSAQTAQTADVAKIAQTAKIAEVAQNAKRAVTADTAKKADTARTADVAAKLSCTGCVGLDALAPDVAKGFVAVKGATMTGPLVAAAGVNLKGSVLGGARLGLVDPAKDACGAAQTGLIGVGAKTRRLYFCDGDKWKRLSVCEPTCPNPANVPCGQPVKDSCGETACQATGTWCASGGACVGGKCTCPGPDQGHPSASCSAVLSCDAKAKTGRYWLDLDGAGPHPAVQAYCDMDTDKGGWMLLYAYAHPKNQTRALNSKLLPTSPTGGYSHRLLQDLGVPAGWAKELRFYCRTSAHGRVVHFKTSNPRILATARDGKSHASVSDWRTGFTKLAGHSAGLPAATNAVWSSSPTAGFTEFPFFQGGTRHWGLNGSGNRWECDDYPNGPGNTTLHRVWVR